MIVPQANLPELTVDCRCACLLYIVPLCTLYYKWLDVNVARGHSYLRVVLSLGHLFYHSS